MIAPRNKKVAHTLLPSFENANSHLPQERLLRSRLYFFGEGGALCKVTLKDIGSVEVSGKLTAYPSPKSTLTLTFDLREGFQNNVNHFLFQKANLTIQPRAVGRPIHPHCGGLLCT